MDASKQAPQCLELLRQILPSIQTCILILAASSLQAEQIQTTGTPGSPSATTTISGNQLPPPPKFGGVIKEDAKDSKPWWAPKIVPPKGAPNVLLIMTDDSGYRHGKESPQKEKRIPFRLSARRDEIQR